MVALRDGRVLVIGGLDTHDWERWQSYSSAYAWDQSSAAGRWTKVGLMTTARAAPAAALLTDGRVLVAGGAYKDGPPYDTAGLEIPGLAAAGSAPRAASAPAAEDEILADISPPDMGSALATAEIFDPVSGRWSTTGPMHYARAGAKAVTLTDGRVLVVGPSALGVPGLGAPSMDERALGTSEVYDPATGRWTIAGSLPPIDWRTASEARIEDWSGYGPDYETSAALVPLPGGDALLVGLRLDLKHGTAVIRSFRFHGGTGRWTQVGRTLFEGRGLDGSGWRTGGGVVDMSRSAVAALPDGRVLVAGGSRLTESPPWATAAARLYDPATGTWTDVADMPWPRTDATAVSLEGGSVLVSGGWDPQRDGTYEDLPPIRYVPPD
jgi:hypothetical protein